MRLGPVVVVLWLILEESLSGFAFAVSLRGFSDTEAGSSGAGLASPHRFSSSRRCNSSSSSSSSSISSSSSSSSKSEDSTMNTRQHEGRHEGSPPAVEGVDAQQQGAGEATHSEPPADKKNIMFGRRPTPAEDAGAPGEEASVAARFPSVTLKLAMDRNGAVDDMSEGPKRFTSQASLDAVHRIRRDCGAVLVGVGTVVRDDPSLTVRRVPLYGGQAQPTRVVLDRTLRLPAGEDCSILRDEYASMVFYSAGCEETEARAVELAAGMKASQGPGSSSPREAMASGDSVDFIGLPPRNPGEGVPLNGVLEALSKRGIDHVLVEGGPSVARGFLSEGLVDRAVIIRAPVEFPRPVPSGMTNRTLQLAGLELIGRTQWGDDEVECWTRPGLSWPGGRVDCWP